MSPVPEDEVKNVVHDVDTIENLDFPDVLIPPGASDSDDIDDTSTDMGGYELLPQDPTDLSNAYIHEDEEDISNSALNSHDNENNVDSTEGNILFTPCSTSSANSNISNRTSSSGQTWRTSEPAVSHQPHLTHYPGGSAGSYLQAPELPKPDKSDILWNQPSHSNTVKMDEKHAAEIKAAMAGFKLPMSNVPDWARNVSDEQWKDTIIPKILSPEKL